MNQPKTARLRNTLLFLAAVVVILATGVRAQEQKLGDLVTEGGFDWMIGKWVAETDEGQRFEMVYKWELNKHMVSVHFKGGDYEYRGMIFYIAPEDKVVQIGIDNRGSTSKGEWEADGDKAVVKSEYTQANGEKGKFGIVHSKVDADTMKAGMYAVESTGELAEEPWGELEYKRQKEQAPKKESGQAP
jgi:hypothetical protein